MNSKFLIISFLTFVQFSTNVFAGLKDDFYNTTISHQDFLLNYNNKFTNTSGLTSLDQTEKSKHFTQKGVVSDFHYDPLYYVGEHKITYYIPAHLDLSKPQKLMILLHGGGASTATYQTAANVAKMYVQGMMKRADELNMIVVAPSSQYGWGYTVRILIPQVLEFVKRDININTNQVVFYGHSMGGMGLARDGAFLTDLGAGILAASSGPQDHYIIDFFLRTYFNAPYIQVNGKYDHFASFEIQAKKVEKKIQELEKNYKMKSKHQLIFHNGSHNPDEKLELKFLKQLFNNPRDMYQKRVFGIFHDLNTQENQWNIPPVQHKLINVGYWLEAVKLKTDEINVSNYQGEATVEKNLIKLNIDKGVEKINIYLSNKLVDLTKEIKLEVNKNKTISFHAKPTPLKTIAISRIKGDPNFIYEDMITLDVEKNAIKQMNEEDLKK